MRLTLREPFARRGEVWDRVANSPSSMPPEDDSLLRHPEMIELMLTQRAEEQSLQVHHAQERVRLALTLRREMSDA